MIYLGAPFTHPDPEVVRQRIYLAKRATLTILEESIQCFSPLNYFPDLSSCIEEKSHEFWMQGCLNLLDACDNLVVLTLPGWKDSKGLQQEILFAIQRRKNIAYYEDEDWVKDGLLEAQTPDGFASYITGLLQFQRFTPSKENTQ